MSVRIINNVDVIAFVYQDALTEKLGDEHAKPLTSGAAAVVFGLVCDRWY